MTNGVGGLQGSRPPAGIAVGAFLILMGVLFYQPQPVYTVQSRDWQAEIPAEVAAVPLPSLKAKAAYLTDAATGATLYSLNPDMELPEASTTKIMTATLAIEHGDLDRVVTVSKHACDAVPANIQMKPGEKFTVRDLLYAMMIHSANDAAIAVAEAVGGTEQRFVAAMNAKAAELGCTHTHFVTPNGLHDPDHYTSVSDLAIMTRWALRHPFFDVLIQTREYHLHRSINQKFVVVRRSPGDRFLYSYAGADGVKTGYTHEAGRCYVGSATRDDDVGPWRLISVVLHAGRTVQETTALMNYGFDAWSRHEVVKAGVTLGKAPSIDGSSQAPLVAMKNLCPIIRRDESHLVVYHYAVSIPAPAAAGRRVGKLQVTIDGETLPLVPLELAASVAAPMRWKLFQITRIAIGCLACLFLIGYYGSITKTRRRRRSMLAPDGRRVDSAGANHGQRSYGSDR